MGEGSQHCKGGSDQKHPQENDVQKGKRISTERKASKMEKPCKVSKNNCGSDHELLIAKFRLKLKKERKTTRPFRYGLNQIPHNSGSDK